MEAIKKKMQAMKVEKDNACDRYKLNGTLYAAGRDCQEKSLSFLANDLKENSKVNGGSAILITNLNGNDLHYRLPQ
jgi:hypothetical protein